MEIKRFKGNGRLSQALICNQVVYLSGQTARGVESDIEKQTEVVLKKIEDLLIECGSGKDKMISATIYLKDMADFAKMNAVWDKWVVPGCEPTRACVHAELAAQELLVEIVVSALV